MKIFCPSHSEQKIGGGFTFRRNIQKALEGKAEFVDNVEDCDIFLVAGVTMVDKSIFNRAKELKKRIIVRVDGVPRNSRNRNTGTSRLLKYCQGADEVIYQSHWARDFIRPFVKKDGAVILNGVDTDIYRPKGEEIGRNGSPQYLYVRYNRDETKRWEKAWYDFQTIFWKNPRAHLWIVGRFSDKNTEYKFDLFGGAEERYKFLGIIDNPVEMSVIYRSADVLLCPYFNDACSNVVAEAYACGLQIKYDEIGGGGIPEQMKKGLITLEKMGSMYMGVFNGTWGCFNKK